MRLSRHVTLFWCSCFYFYHVNGLESPITSAEELKRPAIIVFDPDKIIWPFKVNELFLPLSIRDENVIVDHSYRHLQLYRQIPSLFKQLTNLGHKLALISQSADNSTICQLLDFFKLDQYISYTEVYLGNKTEHAEAVYLKSEIDYGDMLYLTHKFSDVEPMADLGFLCILVDGEKGMTMKDVQKAFHVFSTDSPEYSYSEDTHESSYLHKE